MKAALEVRNLCKSINQDAVLKGVNFTLRRGEIHLIWGENGAGKSVLMRVICGILPFDSGEIEILDRIYTHKTPDPSDSSVIAFFAQENGLVNRLSVFDNLFLSDPFCAKKHGDYFTSRIPLRYLPFCSCLLPILEEKVADISLPQAQILQIMKTVLLDRPILIFDEPTSYLNDYERMQFFDILQDLKAQGKSIIFISHVANKFKLIGDSLSIIRDGVIVRTQPLQALSDEYLVSSYVESEKAFSFPKLPVRSGDVVFEAHRLTGEGLRNISFELHAGEIIGFTGSVSSGHEELCKLLSGLAKRTYGFVRINGVKVSPFDPEHMLKCGFYAFPAVRDSTGIFENRDVVFNIAGVSQAVGRADIEALSRHYISKLHIKTPDISSSARCLSFGNKKKVLLARGVLNRSVVYCFDNPTAGIDLVGINEFYNIINHYLQKGAALILISSNFTELTSMCDRIFFLKDGEIYRTFDRASPEMLYDLCAD